MIGKAEISKHCSTKISRSMNLFMTSTLVSTPLLAQMTQYVMFQQLSVMNRDRERILSRRTVLYTSHGLNRAPSTMYMPRPVTAQDCGFDQHPGGEPYSRFPDQTMDQIPTHVPNHNSKSGYHSGSSRDEEVCHVSTRNRHEQVMEVVQKLYAYPSKLSCHTCGTPQTDELSLDGEHNGGGVQTVNNNEPSPGPGVFQVTDPPDVYPRELGRPPPTVEPWPRLGRSRWLPTGPGQDVTQPSPTRLPLQDAAHKETCEQRIMSLIYHVEALLIAMSNLTRAKMASFIPEELPVDQIKQLMVSPPDSARRRHCNRQIVKA